MLMNPVSRSLLRCIRPAVLWAAVSAAPALAGNEWPQFGGPKRDFKCETKGLADKWPEGGPRQLWSRDLGEGYSSIVVDGDVLYTMYRTGDRETAVALSAKDGKTIWEYGYDAPMLEGMDMQFGLGPHSTPLIAGDKLIVVGVTCKLHALDRQTGKPVWQHDLHSEFQAEHNGRGFGVSPIAYQDLVILPIGGKGHAVLAFRQKDGTIAWQKHDFNPAYASPLIIQYKGKDQLVVLMGKEIAGLEPLTGELIWSHPHKTQFDANLSSPVWCGDDMLFMSSAYDGGSRMIKLTEKDGKIVPEELWFSRRLRIHHGNAVWVGEHVYGSNGDFGPAFLMAVDRKTGQVAWRERDISKATCLFADDKLIVLDEDGNLLLVKATPEKFELLGKCELLKKTAWTAPTLVGKTLYIRDRFRIMALDLG